MAVTIEKRGRRYYLRGNTFPIKEQLRSAGCKWDPNERAWWTGKKEIANKFSGTTPATKSGTKDAAPGQDATVAGRAKYRGKSYYLAGRVQLGRTHWDDTVASVTSRDRSRTLLYFRDGSRQFWANSALVTTERRYDKPQTIGGLARFAKQMRENDGVHPDACPNCGSLSCSTAYGRSGLCDED